MKLGDTALCLDCDEIFELRGAACPACASNTWIPIERFFLRREPRRFAALLRGA